jgi:diguanylate cyclase (GGDEF)-like protein
MANDEQAKAREIQRLLRVGFRVLRFQPDLEADFTEYFRCETLKVWRENAWRIVLAFLLIMTFLLLAHPLDALGVFPVIIAVFAVVLTIAALAVTRGYLRQHFSLLVGGICAVLPALIILGIPSVGSEFMARLAISGAAIFYCVLYSLAHLRWLHVTAWCMLSGPIVVGLQHALGQQTDWNTLQAAWLAPNLVGIVIAYFMEHRERVVFLQDQQIKLEKAEIDSLARQLDSLSRTDPLTGLANRRQFDERLREEWKRMVRAGQPLGLLMLDIDHFKLFNDHQGHPVGDEVLTRVGSILAETASRPSDLAARMGGEEFAVLMPETDQAGCLRVAERIHGRFRELAIAHPASPTAETVTVSVGVHALVPDARCSLESLMKRADEALYQAKKSGRNRTRVWDQNEGSAPAG